jgi:tetrahydromethanopterin S-methyltransferase subunit B
MVSRAKSSSEITTPPPVSVPPPTHVASATNHDFFLQIALEIQRSVGKLEASNQSLTAASEKHATKLDSLTEEVHTAKGMAKAFGWVLGGIGTIVVALLGIILDVMLKHFHLL